MNRETIFSPCRKYRYTLWREWDSKLPYVQFIGLNPSTADETKDDPTVRRCINYAKSWGYGALCMTNIFAFRATDPKVMKKQENPVGLDNDSHLLKCGARAGLIICAWGNHGSFINRDLTVTNFLNSNFLDMHCLGVSQSGQPKHPLYLKKDLKPIRYTYFVK